MSVADTLAARLGAKRIGREWRTNCPCHDDEHPSCDFHDEGGKIVFCCRSRGCPSSDILAAFRRRFPDLLPTSDEGEEWTIRDAAGRPVAVHRRYRKPDGEKGYAWKRPNGESGLGGRPAGSLPLYRLPQLLRAKDAAKGDEAPLVIVTEGEKDADAAARLGFAAVGTVTGAAHVPSDESLRVLVGCRVLLWPDADLEGREHMRLIAQRLTALGRAPEGFIVWPAAPKKGAGAADFHGSRDEALALVRPALEEPAAEKEPTPTEAPRPGPCTHALNAEAVCSLCGLAFGLDVARLHDAPLVAARGRAIAEAGIRYVVDGIVPAYGMLGMLVAYAKTGKTTLGHALGAAVSSGADFLGRRTERARVLYIAAEDPPEYTDFLARHIVTEPGRMTFFEGGVILNDDGLARIATTVKQGGYGLVIIASWQAVIRGLVRDENDNAGAVVVVERVKVATRETKIPWLIDAHSGRNEEQADDADPIRALRGASAAAGSADYILWLRYANGAFGTHRRLSGRGRFVTLAPVTIDYNLEDGSYQELGATKSAATDTTFRLILETGAVTTEPRSADTIARAAGLAPDNGKVNGQTRHHVHAALRNRDGITRTEATYRGRRTTLYTLTPEQNP